MSTSKRTRLMDQFEQFLRAAQTEGGQAALHAVKDKLKNHWQDMNEDEECTALIRLSKPELASVISCVFAVGFMTSKRFNAAVINTGQKKHE